MGMIRRADLETLTRDALAMNLDDLQARGQAIIAEARAHAEQILIDARAERERLIASAHEEGYAAGHGEGLEAGRREGMEAGAAEARQAESDSVASVLAGWSSALEQFERVRDQLCRDAQDDLIRLAGEIATRVVRRAVDLDAGAVEAQLIGVLECVVRPTRLTLRVHPDDRERAGRVLPSLLERFSQCRHADLIDDPSIGRGSVIAETEGGGVIDASIGHQLERIVTELMPEPGARGMTRDDNAEPDSRASDAA